MFLAMGTVLVAVIQLNACSAGVSERTRAPSGEQASPGIAPAVYEVACTPPAKRLSFVSTRSGLEQIYRIDIRRPQEVSRVTRLPGSAMDHTWSPDGSRLAFRWFRRGSVGVFVAEADGSDVQLLVDEAAMPDWSPDGRLIAFANLRDRGISVVDVEEALQGDESAVRIVTRSGRAVPEEQPEWSPDGRQLAFTSHRAGTSDIWLVNADGTDLRNLTPNPFLESGATWSPDGESLVFGSNRAASTVRRGDLFLVAADGSGLRRLTHGRSYGPAWSPDGRWIAFNSTRGGNSDVYLIRPDGTGLRRLTTHPEADGIASWVGRCRAESE